MGPRFAERFPGVQFDQVVLDYFWIPPGWDQSHWTKSFFEHTLPDLCRHNLLRSSNPNRDAACHDESSSVLGGTASPTSSMRVGADLEKDTEDSCDGNKNSHRPAVYLPFTLHCFGMVVAWRHALLQYYDVSFVRQDELHQILLWRGTQQVGGHFMQTVLGKRIDQENVYCHPGDGFVRAIREQGDSAHVASDELLECARKIPNLCDVRFIALRLVAVPVMSLSNVSEQSSECGTPTRGKTTATLPGRILGLTNEESNESSSRGNTISPAKRSLDFASIGGGQAKMQRISDSECTGEGPETINRATSHQVELHGDIGGKKVETAAYTAEECTRKPTSEVASSVDDARLTRTAPEAPRAALVTPSPLPTSSTRRSPRLASVAAAKRKLF
jgi:hypothetical protein